MRLPRIFGGLMFALWAFIGAVFFSISSEFNPGYGFIDGAFIPGIAWACFGMSAISLILVIVQFIKER